MSFEKSLNYLKLLKAKHKIVIRDDFSTDLCGWEVTQGDWHKMTVDTNVDQSSGLIGGIAVDTAGAYDNESIIEKTITLDNYGEIIFEHYVQNKYPLSDEPEMSSTDPRASKNFLDFYIDGILKLSIKGPSPWQRTQPIGISPGEHSLKLHYHIDNGISPGRKAVIDTFTIYEAATINTIITRYTPPTPQNHLVQNPTIRGFTRTQQIRESDTKIDFSAVFLDGIDYQDFIVNHQSIYYFVDEFNIVYRGVFPDRVDPEMIARGSAYVVSLSMFCPQKAGVGFV